MKKFILILLLLVITVVLVIVVIKGINGNSVQAPIIPAPNTDLMLVLSEKYILFE
ncbi:MAG: hypothetical protein IKJ14_01035 [Clostridia bacterium]|nr:hypothetical protein [Clostridia bacterium]